MVTALKKSNLAEVRPDAEKVLFVWDQTVPGFGYKLTPNGAKSWVYQYRIRGRSRRMTIGPVTDALTLSQARDKAKRLAALVLGGVDPLEEKIAARNAKTVDDLLDLYFESAAFADKAASTQAVDRGRADAHLRPLLGGRDAETLTREDVRKARAAIAAGKTARVEKATKPRGRRVIRGGEGSAGQAVALLGAVFSWALREDVLRREASPCVGVPGYVSKHREIAVEPGDYRRIFDALAKLEEERIITSPAADAIRLIAWHGLRRSEAALLRWRNVDLAAGRIIFSPGEHKGGKRSGAKREIELTAEARAAIERQPRGEPDDFVFASRKAGSPISLNPPWTRVAAEAKLAPGFVLHGLRHALGGVLGTAGASAVEIAAALGHRQASTAERYVTFAQQARRAIAERAAAAIAADLALEESKP
jgi:integrase